MALGISDLAAESAAGTEKQVATVAFLVRSIIARLGQMSNRVERMFGFETASFWLTS